MTIKEASGAPEGRPCAGIASQLQPRALDRWNSSIRAAKGDAEDETLDRHL